MISSKCGKSSAHAFCPIAGAELSARVGFAFYDDFFHGVLLMILASGSGNISNACSMDMVAQPGTPDVLLTVGIIMQK